MVLPATTTEIKTQYQKIYLAGSRQGFRIFEGVLSNVEIIKNSHGNGFYSKSFRNICGEEVPFAKMFNKTGVKIIFEL